MSRAPVAPWDLASAAMEPVLAKLERERAQGLWGITWRRLRRNRAAFTAFWFLALVAVGSLLAPLYPLPSPIAMHAEREPQAPVLPLAGGPHRMFESNYWKLSAFDRRLVDVRVLAFKQWQTPALLGTDAQGRDLLSRLVWGSRTSLFVAACAALTSLLIGVTWGALSALAGGVVDRVMMRIVDGLYGLPFTFLVIFVLGLLGASSSVAGISREAVFFVAIGALYWLTMARVVRTQVLSLKHSEFVLAAKAQGAGALRILFAHVIPNVLGVVAVYLTLTIPAVILSEAFLSFLGLGVAPPKPSWGLLAAEAVEAASPLRVYWWLIVFPAAAIACVLLALNVLGDGLRDALDPAHAERGAAP